MFAACMSYMADVCWVGPQGAVYLTPVSAIGAVLEDSWDHALAPLTIFEKQDNISH